MFETAGSREIAGSAIEEQHQQRWSRLDDFRRGPVVESVARHAPPAADRDVADAHGQSREMCMQDRSHRQDPLVGLVALPGEAMSPDELEREFRDELLKVVDEYVPALRAARSCWTSFANVIEQECAEPDAAAAPQVRGV